MPAPSYYDRRSKKKYIAHHLGIIFVVVLVVTVVFAFIFKVFAKRKIGQVEATTEEGRVSIGGKVYVPKTNIRTYLLIGEDDVGQKKAKKEYDGRGQCDVLQLLVFDKDKKTYTRIPINRNTMCDVKSLDEDGTDLATTRLQISYAHANGDGMEVSCENTVDAVSNLFHGVPIQEYACLNMDSIKIVNQLAGGVRITFPDDYTEIDPSFIRGETVTLSDDQADAFVHARMSLEDDSNEYRMARQEVYLAALKDNYRQKLQADEGFATNVYKAVEPYMVTSLSLGDVSRLAKLFLQSEDSGRTEIDGKKGEDEDGFATFEANADTIDRICTELFFEEAE